MSQPQNEIDLNLLMYIYTKRLNRVLAQSCPTLCELWTVVHQAPPSMEFSRQDYWSGLPFPFPGGLPDPGIEPGSPTLQAATFPSEPLGILYTPTSEYTNVF